MISLPNKSDVAIASKAINLSPDLSASARRVAGALLDHFNRNTGRCDPSIERLAELLDINRATVLRATAELSKKELFVKRSHGGHFHCASYEPQWHKFREIVSAWDTKMKGVTPEDNVAVLRLSESQDCDVKRRNNATQTNLTNQSYEPILSIATKIERGTDREAEPPNNNLPPSKADSPQKGLGMKGSKQPRQRYLIHALNGGKSPTHLEAAEQSATRRLNADLMRDMPTYLEIVDKITPAIQAAAVEAELVRAGSGALVAYRAIREAGCG